MKVYGYEVASSQKQNALKRVIGKSFELKDLEEALINEGVPAMNCKRQNVANRVADRMVQALKTEGKVEFREWSDGRRKHHKWYWILEDLERVL